VPAWSVGCRVVPSRPVREHKKGTVLVTVPQRGAAAGPRHGARTYRVFPRESSG
jgi:hypothetical protein